MSDRDRLAADLHGEDPTSGGPNNECGCYLTADRLIALGWTRLDEERLTEIILDAIVSPEAFGPIRDERRLDVYRRIASRAAAKAYAALREEDGR